MKLPLKTSLAACITLLGGQAMAQITLYQGEGWRGRAVSISSSADDLSRAGFNDRASSVVVERGRWEVCEDAGFRGECRILKRGSYDSLAGMGLDNSISSVRQVRGNRVPAVARMDVRAVREMQRPTAIDEHEGGPVQPCRAESASVISAGNANFGDWLRNAIGLRRTTCSMSASECFRRRISAMKLGTASGSLGPQSQAPATRIRSGPYFSIMSTARAVETFVCG